MKGKNDENETEMYLCGEEYSGEYKVSGDYFSSIARFVGAERLRRAHSGDLSQYLYWLVLGTVFITVALVVMWA